MPMTRVMIPTAWRRGLVFQEARPCSARFLLGMKRLASLSTRICRVDRSGARRRVPVAADRATTDRAVAEGVEGARASVVMRLFLTLDAALRGSCVGRFAVLLSIVHELPDCASR